MTKSITKEKNQKGFTLIELLIVIAIVAILAGVVFVALDPLTRFQDARDSTRWSAVSEIAQTIKLDQVDNEGPYLTNITDMTVDVPYMIGVITDPVAGRDDCDTMNDTCAIDITDATHCVDLTAFVTDGYLPVIPISPSGAGDWDANFTGYVLTKFANGTIKVDACDPENVAAISITR